MPHGPRSRHRPDRGSPSGLLPSPSSPSRRPGAGPHRATPPGRRAERSRRCAAKCGGDSASASLALPGPGWRSMIRAREVMVPCHHDPSAGRYRHRCSIEFGSSQRSTLARCVRARSRRARQNLEADERSLSHPYALRTSSRWFASQASPAAPIAVSCPSLNDCAAAAAFSRYVRSRYPEQPAELADAARTSRWGHGHNMDFPPGTRARGSSERR